MNKKITKALSVYVLCLEDNLKDAELFQEMLHDSGYLVKMDIVSQEEQYISSLKANNYDIILADYTLPGFDAPAALKLANLLRPEVPFICVSGTIGEDTAVELLKQGATDYVLKDRIGRLAFAVQRALEESETQKDWKKAQADLQKKEDENKKSELRYKYMFHNNPQPMWIYDLDTLKFLEVNHAAVVNYGYSRDEFLSMTLKDIRPKEDIDTLLKDLELTRKVYNSAGEWRHVKKNGELMCVEVVSYSIFFGEIEARHVMVTDITNRKLAEEKVRESEERFRVAQEMAPDGFTILHPARNQKGEIIDFTWVYENQTIASINGTDPQAVVGKRLLDLFPNHLGTSVFETYLHVANTGNPQIIEEVYVGDVISIPTWLRLVVVSMGEYIAILSQDITERKKVEEALRLSENHSAFLAQTAFELVELTSIQEIYKYTVQKLYDLFEGNSIVSLVEFNYGENHWKMQQITGVGKKADKLSRLLGFDVNNMEGDISKKYHEQITSGKLIELDFDFPNLFNNKLSAAIGSAVKKMFSIEKIYCIAYQQDEQIMANITFTTNKKSQPIRTKLIETFIQQVSNFAKRQKAEEALHQSEARFRTIFEIASLGIVQVDPMDGKIILVNSYFEIITGYQIDELLKMTFIELTHPDDREKDWEIFSKAARGEVEYRNEKRYVKKDGTIVWVRIHLAFIRDEKGKAIRTVAICEDISERKHFELALKDSEALYRKLVERLPDGIYKTTREGRFVDVNPAMVTMLGYESKEELMAVDINKQLYFNDERANDVNKNKVGVLVVYRLKKKDGSEIWVEDHSWYVTDDNGEVLYNEGVIRDFTQRKNAEDGLIKLSRAVEQSPVSILITDINGNIEYVNAKALALTGYEFEELKGKNPRIFSSGKKSREEYRILWETILSGKEWRGEMHNKKKNGELYWEFASISPIKNKIGQITHFLAVKEDITERKQTEKDLRELEIARKTARFKQNFLANMSHEIRTPLTGVLGMIDILELTQLTDNQQDYVNTIKTSGENLKEIINQVLDYSKIEAGKIKINPLDFEFQSILHNAEMLYRNITRPGVKVQIQLDPAIPRFIKTDKIRLSQVINNLFSNALKFTHKGSVSVQARLLSRITQNQQVKIEIKVVDTGIGIPAHLQEKLFSPFSQIDDNDTRYYEGTGLGLSICKELVGLLGGEIGVESDSSSGSTFWFTFMAQIAEYQQEPEPRKDKYTNHKSLHILLTEDKVVNQKVISLMLKALGHTVTIANNGSQAIELYESDKFDLILMDIQMPVMNGITATQILKERYASLCPVIGLSANAFEGDREKYMNLCMDEYLAKPVKSSDFQKMLQHFFGSDMEPVKG